MAGQTVSDAAQLATIAYRAMKDRDLDPDFPPEVLKELEGIQIPASFAQESMKDLRDLPWISIDNDDSKDLDQITYAQQLANDHTKVYVAIADVDALVPRGSAIDVHAQINTTSVYTPSLVFPMLPLKLSTGLTSLNENEERCALVIEYIIEKDGRLADSDIYRAFVKNHAKLAYPSVAAWLQSEAKPPKPIADSPKIAEQVRLQDSIAQKIKSFRHSQGALSFRTAEMFPLISNGKIVGLQETVIDRARELIENFMITANVCATRYLRKIDCPILTRVVRTPKRWDRIVEVAAGYKTKLPDEPDVVALEAFLVKQNKQDPAGFPLLSLTMIKLLGRGEYVAEIPANIPLGHFDLALRDYAHTTAPNRRYPDLIMHRLLKNAMQGTCMAYPMSELNAVARRCTQKEDDAAKVERRVKKSAQAMALSRQIGAHFAAIVTGASDKGTWVRLFNPPVEGKLVKGFQGLDVGDRINVQLVSVNIPNGYIDFALI